MDIGRKKERIGVEPLEDPFESEPPVEPDLTPADPEREEEVVRT